MGNPGLNLAYEVATDTASHGAERPPSRRRHWSGQRQWDRLHMATESTQFPRYLDEELRELCHDAGLNRSRLIAYMLKTWMAAYSLQKEREKHADHGIDEPFDGD